MTYLYYFLEIYISGILINIYNSANVHIKAREITFKTKGRYQQENLLRGALTTDSFEALNPTVFLCFRLFDLAGNNFKTIVRGSIMTIENKNTW